MEERGVNLLFYSPMCPYCIECLQILEPFAQKISFIGYVNIHKARDSLPILVRQVPTLVLNNGETVYEGRDVYLWITGLINMIQSQDEPTKKKEEERNNKSSVPVHQPEHQRLEPVWSSSSLGNNKSSGGRVFSAIDDYKTITENIDYSKIKSIKTDDTKLTVSPDSLVEQRKNEIEKYFPR